MFSANEVVKEIRLKKGLTQKAFAEFLGLPKAQYISNIERNACAVGPVFVARILNSNVDLKLYTKLVMAARKDLVDSFNNTLEGWGKK